MAVADRKYRCYEGPLTPEWSRFLIIPRYAFQEVFGSRLLAGFFAFCFAGPVFCAAVIYLHHNLSALGALRMSPAMLAEVSGRFFMIALLIQAQMGFLLTFLVGPELISSDLKANGLPLYLCRPISRAEYVLGKIAVLAILLSLITWVPFLLLFFLQSYLEGAGWMLQNLRIGLAIFLASLCWIAVISLLALALSAWVRRKAAARLLMIGVFFVLSAFGGAINVLFRTRWGNLIDLSKVLTTLWAGLFGVTDLEEMPPWSAWAALVLMAGFCLMLLWRKITAYQVVR